MNADEFRLNLYLAELNATSGTFDESMRKGLGDIERTLGGLRAGRAARNGSKPIERVAKPKEPDSEEVVGFYLAAAELEGERLSALEYLRSRHLRYDEDVWVKRVMALHEALLPEALECVQLAALGTNDCEAWVTGSAAKPTAAEMPQAIAESLSATAAEMWDKALALARESAAAEVAAELEGARAKVTALEALVNKAIEERDELRRELDDARADAESLRRKLGHAGQGRRKAPEEDD